MKGYLKHFAISKSSSAFTWKILLSYNYEPELTKEIMIIFLCTWVRQERHFQASCSVWDMSHCFSRANNLPRFPGEYPYCWDMHLGYAAMLAVPFPWVAQLSSHMQLNECKAISSTFQVISFLSGRSLLKTGHWLLFLFFLVKMLRN